MFKPAFIADILVDMQQPATAPALFIASRQFLLLILTTFGRYLGSLLDCFLCHYYYQDDVMILIEIMHLI